MENGSRSGDSNIIGEDEADNNIVPVAYLPSVAPTESVMDPTADKLIDSSNNVVENNNDIARTIDPPTTAVDNQQSTGNESQHVPVETSSKRERKRPTYLADYVCDGVTTTQEFGMTGAQASNRISSRQLKIVEPADQGRMQLIHELSALIQQLRSNMIGRTKTKKPVPIASIAPKSAFLSPAFEMNTCAHPAAINNYLFAKLPLSSKSAIFATLSTRNLPHTAIQEMNTQTKLGEEELLHFDDTDSVDIDTTDTQQDDWLTREVALLGITAGDDLDEPLQSSSAMDTSVDSTTSAAEMQPKNIDKIAAVTTHKIRVQTTCDTVNWTLTCNCIVAGPSNGQHFS